MGRIWIGRFGYGDAYDSIPVSPEDTIAFLDAVAARDTDLVREDSSLVRRGT